LEHIIFAKLAWREMFLGYPCHWDKVYSSLMAAAALAKDTVLHEELSNAAKLFKKAVISNDMYRPEFERLAALTANTLSGKELFDINEASTTQMCLECANKHYAAAMAAWSPTNMKKCLCCLGHLAHVSDHLVELSVPAALIVRDERKELWKSFIAGGDVYKPDFEEIGTMLVSLAVDADDGMLFNSKHANSQ